MSLMYEVDRGVQEVLAGSPLSRSVTTAAGRWTEHGGMLAGSSRRHRFQKNTAAVSVCNFRKQGTFVALGRGEREGSGPMQGGKPISFFSLRLRSSGRVGSAHLGRGEGSWACSPEASP